jgi:hypothetical protein
VADPRLIRILEQLRASKFAELKGARVTATMPLPKRLLNEIIAAMLPRSAPVRDVTVQPKESNRVTVRAKLARAEFLPPFNLTLQIEQQPQLPDGPLVLRLLSLPGLMPLASAAVSMIASLPPGVRLEGDRLLVDVRTLLERNGQGEVLTYLDSVRITSEEGRLLVDVSLRA